MAESVVAIDYDKDCQWFDDNYEELKEKFAGKAIAIMNGGIIHSDEDYLKFLEYLRSKGIDPSAICVEVFPEDDAAYIL